MLTESCGPSFYSVLNQEAAKHDSISMSGNDSGRLFSGCSACATIRAAGRRLLPVEAFPENSCLGLLRCENTCGIADQVRRHRGDPDTGGGHPGALRKRRTLA